MIPQSVKPALENALIMNESYCRQLPVTRFAKEMCLVQLSTNELKSFGVNATQVPSKSSILVETEMYYKLPIAVSYDFVQYLAHQPDKKEKKHRVCQTKS